MSGELIASMALVLSNIVTVLGCIFSVKKIKSEAKKLDAETQQITKNCDKQLVDEYRETMVNPWKQEVQELRAEEKRLRKAVRAVYDCRHRRDCPVCKRLLDEVPVVKGELQKISEDKKKPAWDADFRARIKSP